MDAVLGASFRRDDPFRARIAKGRLPSLSLRPRWTMSVLEGRCLTRSSHRNC